MEAGSNLKLEASTLRQDAARRDEELEKHKLNPMLFFFFLYKCNNNIFTMDQA